MKLSRRRVSAEKPRRIYDTVEVVYDEERWRLLTSLRREAQTILEALARRRIEGYVYGSLARGDVDEGSDIDVVVPKPVPTHVAELALLEAGYTVEAKTIVQATPRHAVKAHLYLDLEAERCVTIPLVKFKPLEWEFYKFGGLAGLEELRSGVRVPGVTKRLTLIQPTPRGHLETSVVGREAEVARKLGVSERIVRERVEVLTRRDRVGRTGVYLKLEIPPEESFEEALRRIALEDPAVRRKLRASGFEG